MNKSIISTFHSSSLKDLTLYKKSLNKILSKKTITLIHRLISRIRNNLKPDDIVQTSLSSYIVSRIYKRSFEVSFETLPLSDILTIKRNRKLILDTRIEAKKLSLPYLWRQIYRNSIKS